MSTQTATVILPILLLLGAWLFAHHEFGSRTPTPREPIYWTILLVACCFYAGCSTGVLISTRVNSAVAIGYVQALDWERQAIDKATRAQLQATADIAVATLKADTAIEKAKTQRDITDMAAHYSAEILGLRQQLQAAGVAERVLVPVAR